MDIDFHLTVAGGRSLRPSIGFTFPRSTSTGGTSITTISGAGNGRLGSHLVQGRAISDEFQDAAFQHGGHDQQTTSGVDAGDHGLHALDAQRLFGQLRLLGQHFGQTVLLTFIETSTVTILEQMEEGRLGFFFLLGGSGVRLHLQASNFFVASLLIVIGGLLQTFQLFLDFGKSLTVGLGLQQFVVGLAFSLQALLHFIVESLGLFAEGSLEIFKTFLDFFVEIHFYPPKRDWTVSKKVSVSISVGRFPAL